jgi:flagellar motility protein MotE (MotC chaperone)
MLDQSIAEVRALKAKVTALEQLVGLDNQILAKKDETIADQKRLIDIYEKRKGTTVSFLFGLIKIRKN